MSVSDGTRIYVTYLYAYRNGISMDNTVVSLCTPDGTSTQGMTSCGRPSQYLNGARNLFDGSGRWYQRLSHEHSCFISLERMAFSMPTFDDTST